MERASELLRNSWFANDWLSYTQERGTTRRAAHFVFRTTARMLGADYLNELSRLRRYPYRALLATSLLPDESDRLRQHGLHALETDPNCVRGDAAVLAFGGMMPEREVGEMIDEEEEMYDQSMKRDKQTMMEAMLRRGRNNIIHVEHKHAPQATYKNQKSKGRDFPVISGNYFMTVQNHNGWGAFWK